MNEPPLPRAAALLSALALLPAACGPGQDTAEIASPHDPAPAAPDAAIAHHPDDPAALFAGVCAACHGPAGKGNREIGAPSIAFLPEYYVIAQLEKFQKDIRGTDPEDLTGTQMRAVAHALDPGAIEKIAAHVASLPRAPTQNTLGGDAVQGKKYYQWYCEECHRVDGSGELVFGSPPLVGLNDWYLLAQIRKFQQGVRGAHPDDVHGMKMLIPAERVLDEQELKDLLAYIALLAEQYEDEDDRESPAS